MAKLPVAMTLILGLIGGCAAIPSSDATNASSARRCRDRSFDVYFATGDDRLTLAAANALRAETARANRCAMQRVTIVGMSDSVSGTQQANLDLSARRAATVAERLIALGVPSGLIAQDAVGEQGASTGRMQRPVRRRTQVQIDFQ